MQRYRDTYNNPITQAPNFGHVTKGKRMVDGLVHVCADGHNHASENEVHQCIEAHRVFVCSTNHMHTAGCDSERCDQIRREEELLKDKELQRQHDREMMDKQIRLAETLRCMGWNFKTQGIPPIGWLEKQIKY